MEGSEIKRRLVAILGEDRVKDDEANLEKYSKDMTEAPEVRPNFVVFPKSTEEVAAIVKLANEARLPLTPRVAGTNLGGLTIPSPGGCVVDLSQMNRVLEVNPSERYAIIEPGVTFEGIKQHLDEGRYDLVIGYPLSPPWTSVVANCLLDGLGNLSFRYGTMAEWINGIEAVLPTGEVIRAGSCALSPLWFNRAPMPDLVGLFVSWQGTTGIVTKMAVQLWPRRAERVRTFIMFYTWKEAFEMLARFARYNIYDDIGGLSWVTSKLLFKIEKPGPKDPNEPIFFLYLDISAEDKEELNLKLRMMNRELERARDQGMQIESPMDVKTLVAINPDFDKFAEFPTYLDFLMETKGRGLTWVGTYGPVNRLAEGAEKCEKIMWDHGFPPTLVIRPMKGGHYAVLRCISIFDRSDPADVKRAAAVNAALCDQVLEMGYIPYKSPAWAVRKFLPRLDPGYLRTLERVKEMLDPNNIMNPGKWLLGTEELKQALKSKG